MLLPLLLLTLALLLLTTGHPSRSSRRRKTKRMKFVTCRPHCMSYRQLACPAQQLICLKIPEQLTWLWVVAAGQAAAQTCSIQTSGFGACATVLLFCCDPVCLCSEKVSSALFFKYNTQLGPPYQVLVDTNFINFSIKNKVRLQQDTPLVSHAVFAAAQRACAALSEGMCGLRDTIISCRTVLLH